MTRTADILRPLPRLWAYRRPGGGALARRRPAPVWRPRIWEPRRRPSARLLSGDRLLSDPGDLDLSADGDRLLDDAAGNTCCCCTCCSAACVNCTDGPTAAPSWYLLVFDGVTFATDCLSVTNMGHTTTIRYGRFPFPSQAADVGVFAAGYVATKSSLSCRWGLTGDNSSSTLPHGPEFLTWFEGHPAPCDTTSLSRSITRGIQFQLQVDASTIRAEVFHFARDTTNPLSYASQSPALSFQGTASFDGRCRATWTIPNGLTSAGIYQSYFILDGDGNPVNCAGLGLGGTLTITPCGEVDI